MSSLFVSQILLTTMMVLKQAYGPALLAIVPFIPNVHFRDSMRLTFHRAYEDASLFHVSELDGHDLLATTSPELRESFRRFLVDAHKAAYVPVCLARGATKDPRRKSFVFTSEPACVVKHDSDVLDTPRPDVNVLSYGQQFSFGHTHTSAGATSPAPAGVSQLIGDELHTSPLPIRSESYTESYTQFGVSLRRVATRYLTELETSGRQFNDDGSVTTTIVTPRSSSPRYVAVGPQNANLSSTEKVD